MNVSSRAALLLCALTLVLRAPTSAAQSNTLIPATPIPTTALAPEVERSHVGPTADALTVGVRPVIVASPTSPAARSGAGLGQNEAMMIVGGAAILVGAIVGGDAGDVFMIGGAIVGLYGLYKYLQ
jgi:hypothetical protein